MRRASRIWLLSSPAWLVLASSCACDRSQAPAQPVPTEPAAAAPSVTEAKVIQHFPGRGEIRVAGRTQGPVFRVELARLPEERQQGLMFRRTLADDQGMLFFMPQDDDWVFFMRNTYVRLDMIFVDKDWQVVGVVADVPPLTEDHRSVGEKSRYVLELAAHQAERHGIKAGTRLEFKPLPDEPPPAGAGRTAGSP